MRTFYRVEIPQYGEAKYVSDYEIAIPKLALTVYLIAAKSVEEAISKVPPAENREQITKVSYLGPMVVID